MVKLVSCDGLIKEPEFDPVEEALVMPPPVVGSVEEILLFEEGTSISDWLEGGDSPEISFGLPLLEEVSFEDVLSDGWLSIALEISSLSVTVSFAVEAPLSDD